MFAAYQMNISQFLEEWRLQRTLDAELQHIAVAVRRERTRLRVAVRTDMEESSSCRQTTAHVPLSASASMAGMSSDQTLAATITPEANPNRAFCRRTGISFFIRKTNPDPNIVPNKGISNPIMQVAICSGQAK